MCESQVEDLDSNIDNRLPLETPATTVVYMGRCWMGGNVGVWLSMGVVGPELPSGPAGR